MTIKEFRMQRIAAEISAVAVARKANIDRTRLSLIENGRRDVTEDEMRRLETALGVLIQERRQLAELAADAGLSFAGFRL